jgi:hypothetical protein
MYLNIYGAKMSLISHMNLTSTAKFQQSIVWMSMDYPNKQVK